MTQKISGQAIVDAIGDTPRAQQILDHAVALHRWGAVRNVDAILDLIKDAAAEIVAGHPQFEVRPLVVTLGLMVRTMADGAPLDHLN